jgi:hypothetical protein
MSVVGLNKIPLRETNSIKTFAPVEKIETFFSS